MLSKHQLKPPWERSGPNLRVLLCAPWLVFAVAPMSLFCMLSASPKYLVSSPWPVPPFPEPLFVMSFLLCSKWCSVCLGNYQLPGSDFRSGAWRADVTGQAAYMLIIEKTQENCPRPYPPEYTPLECMPSVKEGSAESSACSSRVTSRPLSSAVYRATVPWEGQYITHCYFRLAQWAYP